MKKIVLITLLVLGILALLSFVYTLIPQKISVTALKSATCTLNGAERMVFYTDKWTRWWPGKVSPQPNPSGSSSPVFIFRDFKYTPGIVSLNLIEVNIICNNMLFETELMILPLNSNSVQLEWKCKEIEASKNPIARIKQYRTASKIKKNLDLVLDSLRSFLERAENIYGMKVNTTKVKDSILVATKFVTPSYPTTAEIYSAVKKLKRCIEQEQAAENNFPMMHVQSTDSNHYETMIAIPVNKQLPERNNTMVKRMVLGNILEAQIKGGVATVRSAMQQLENYRRDYNLQSPAIPFALLVTDRSIEADTTKWITRIYYPIY